LFHKNSCVFDSFLTDCFLFLLDDFHFFLKNLIKEFKQTNMKQYIIVICLLFNVQLLIAQIKTQPVKDLPKGIAYKGKVLQALKWTDKAGENILVTATTEPFKSKNQNTDNVDISNQDKELYAYLYVKKGTSYEMLWKVTDFVRECPLDITVQYLDNSLEITDLDKNGIAEVWLVYRTACRADVSPATQKIIMREGDNKYAVRGTTKIAMPGEEPYGGEMKVDDAFKAGKKEFRDYATKIWKKYEKEFDQ
jgi:hypothetical protein